MLWSFLLVVVVCVAAKTNLVTNYNLAATAFDRFEKPVPSSSSSSSHLFGLEQKLQRKEGGNKESVNARKKINSFAFKNFSVKNLNGGVRPS